MSKTPIDFEDILDPVNYRLHGSTLWLPLVDAMLGLLFPLIAGIFFMPVGLLLFAVVGFGCLSAVYHAIRYLTVRYRITHSELVLHSGIIHRRERRIPFDRVQETQIHQRLLYRLLGLAKLEVTTAGSDLKEANLHVITKHRAEFVKAAIDGGERSFESGESQAHPTVYSCRLSTGDLLLGGLTSTLVAGIGAVVATILYFQLFVGVGTHWMGKVEREVEAKISQRTPVDVPKAWEEWESHVPDLGPLNFAVDFYFAETLPKGLTLAVLGLIGSVAVYVVRFHGFCLTLQEDVLRTTFGLLTRRQTSLSRDRIQTLKLEESLLRRPFGLVSVRVDSAGDRQEIGEAKNRDVMLPVAKKAVAFEVAREAMPGLTELEPAWQRISALAVLRGSKKGWAIVLLAMSQTHLVAGWYWLAWLPALPFVYFLNLQWYRNTGFLLSSKHFLSRRGWLNRSTTCLPVKNIQNVTIMQSYFDRRLGLATLSIDTAGQSNTGGGPVIRHLPITEATDLQQTLASRAAACEFNW
jgi:putative membrane protein